MKKYFINLVVMILTICFSTFLTGQNSNDHIYNIISFEVKVQENEYIELKQADGHMSEIVINKRKLGVVPKIINNMNDVSIEIFEFDRETKRLNIDLTEKLNLSLIDGSVRSKQFPELEFIVTNIETKEVTDHTH